MKSLLIIAHGSRRDASNKEVQALGERVHALSKSIFDEVSVAFLEFASPSIPEGLETAIKRGAGKIIVFPYFLSAGQHVVNDITREIDSITEKYPEVTVRVTPYLGKSDELPEVIMKIIEQSV